MSSSPPRSLPVCSCPVKGTGHHCSSVDLRHVDGGRGPRSQQQRLPRLGRILDPVDRSDCPERRGCVRLRRRAHPPRPKTRDLNAIMTQLGPCSATIGLGGPELGTGVFERLMRRVNGRTDTDGSPWSIPGLRDLLTVQTSRLLVDRAWTEFRRGTHQPERNECRLQKAQRRMTLPSRLRPSRPANQARRVLGGHFQRRRGVSGLGQAPSLPLVLRTDSA